MKETLREKAERLGISIETLKRHWKEEGAKKLVDKSIRETRPTSAGWNPRSGPKHGLRDLP